MRKIMFECGEFMLHVCLRNVCGFNIIAVAFIENKMSAYQKEHVNPYYNTYLLLPD